MSVIVPAVVTGVSPLRIAMVGDEAHPIPALTQAPYVPAVGDHVQVRARRSGLLPIVQGKFS